jgi:hypothetical protein
MGRTNAERQKAYREREADRRAEHARLCAEVKAHALELDRRSAVIAELEDQLAEADQFRAAVAERDQLRSETQRQASEIERLEAELADALDQQPASRCKRHGAPMVTVCPECHRGEDW